MEQIKLTRKELYDLVWAEPLSRLAKKYKISDNGLRKICKRMNIPIPALGHWQRVQYGKKVDIFRLPQKYDGVSEIILYEKGSENEMSDSPKSQQKRLIKSIEEAKDLQLSVPDRLSSRPDPLIRNTINYYESLKRYYKYHRGNYPDKINVLNIDVKEENRPRAFRFLDTIIKVLKARNHDVVVNHFTTCVVIDEEQVDFRLRERQRVSEVKNKWGGRVYESSGEFVFVIDIGSYSRKEISDSHEPIESKISTIVANLELEGRRMKEAKIASEIRRQQWEEQKRIEREIREKQEREIKEFKKLFLQAIRLHQTNIIRNYVNTIIADRSEKGTVTEEFSNWVTWAKEKLSWYDPLINGPDSLLHDQHKTLLFKEFLKEWQ